MTTNTGIGEPVRRKEDARLLVGAGCYSDDVDLPRQARAFVVRSVHAHARIKEHRHRTRAKALKGVLAVLTGADLKADGLKPMPPDASTTVPIEAQRKLPDVVLVNRDGPLMPTPYYPLAVGKVRYVGEAVALVVAETLAIAKDAGELVEIDYESLPAVVATAPRRPEAARRLFDGARVERLPRRRSRRCGGDRTRIRERRSCGEARNLGSARHRRADGSAHRRRQLRQADAGATSCMPAAAASSARRASLPPCSASSPSRCAWSRSTSAAISAPRIRSFPSFRWCCGRRSGRAAGQMDVRAQRGVSQRLPGPRSGRQGRACARREGRFLAMRGSHLSNVGGYSSSIVPLRKGVSIFSGVYRCRSRTTGPMRC